MTDTTTPAELAIPDDSVTRLHLCHREGHLHDPDRSCVRGISEPVVAAELRRLAGFVDSQLSRSQGARHEGLSSVWALLMARADELDPR